MEHIIYKIVFSNGNYYIGYSSKKDKRFKRHVRDLLNGTHHNKNVQKVFNILGLGSMAFEILLSFENEIDARTKEEILITESFKEDFSNILNESRYSSGGDLISYHVNKDDIKRRRSISHKETIASMSDTERREKFGRKGSTNGMFGKTHTDEVKKILSDKAKGNSYSLGFKHSEETKHKFSEIASKRVAGKNPFFGKKHSDEFKKRQSDFKKGSIPTNRRKVSCKGTSFPSVSAASKEFGITAGAMIYRLNSDNYPDFIYLPNA